MGRMKEKVKHAIEFGMNFGMLQTLKKKSAGKILLLLSPQYLNYGDHAIALSEMYGLRELFPDTVVLDVNYSLFTYWEREVREAVCPGDTLVVTGGGYMGNLWPENHALAEKIIDLFPDNRIVFAPQTLFYRETPTAEEEKERFAAKLRKHGNFFFFGRDEQSCRQMEALGFSRGVDFDLLPDFVLMLPPVLKLKLQSKQPALCLRADAEATQNRVEALSKLLENRFGGQVSRILMAKDHVEIPTAVRRQMLQKKMQQFADARVVITDRLHGMVFAAYAGTPCIAFDNVSGKISGVYQWIRELDYVMMAEDISQVPQLLDRIQGMDKEENRKKFIAVQEKLSREFLPKFADKVK